MLRPPRTHPPDKFGYKEFPYKPNGKGVMIWSFILAQIAFWMILIWGLHNAI